MTATDAMLAGLQAELEERKLFMDGLVEAAQSAGRDMTTEETDLYVRARDRMKIIRGQMEPLEEGSRIAAESAAKAAKLQEAYVAARNPAAVAPVEYRSAGAYVADLYYARMGDEDSARRLDIYHRVAAHQTTADNPGLLPERIVTPVLDFIDTARPLVTAIGPMDLGIGSWSYARVTQHTQVGPQAAEKTELASRKMIISKTPLDAPTLGGYVNVSRQNIVRTQPGILDMVINDLAGQYAIETEEATGTVLEAAAVAGPTFPADATAAQLAAAIYGAAGQVYAATAGQGRVVVAVSPDMLGVIGPLFPPINPQNGFGSGFSAAGFQSGNVGSVSGLSVVMSAGLPTGTVLVFSTAAVKSFEYRYGSLQVVEPSVWGVQVGYAGDFVTIVVEATGIVSVTQAP